MRRNGASKVHGLRLWFAFLAVALLAAAPSHAGQPLYVVFAKCTGQLSAEMEHNWMFQERPTDQIAAQRGAFVDILQAVIPAGQGRHALSLRIESKFAHRALLMRADFNDDPTDARWASARADEARRQCVGLLLS